MIFVSIFDRKGTIVMKIGEKIKILRKQKGMSQKELGIRFGVSQQMIGQYENSISEPKIETLRKIAVGLEVELSDLLEVVFSNR